jgi:acetolactate synthase-1/2/3 large subunit
MTNQTGGAYLAAALKGYGVSHVFFVDAILRHTLAHLEFGGVNRILAHSEKGAAYMADGFARASRRPAVCMAQSVGAANLAAGLQDAYFANSPVIAITGRHIAQNQYRNAYQELSSHEPLFSQVTKFSGRIEVPAQLSQLVRHAFREASSGRPGPVHLDIAGLTGSVADKWEIDQVPVAELQHSRIPAYRTRPDSESIKVVAKLLNAAKKPLIVLGIGAYWSGAGELVRRIADLGSIPVTGSLDVKALIDASGKHGVGIVGTYGTDVANHALHEADVVFFVGSDVGDQVTGNWTLLNPASKFIQLDVVGEELGRNLPGAICVVSDPSVGLEELLPILERQERGDWYRRIADLRNKWDAAKAAPMLESGNLIRPERICDALTKWLPADAIVVADTGYSSQWAAQYMHLNHPSQRFLRAAGSLGWGFPAALGAKAAHPGSPVICFTGDGGFMYHLPELETAKRWGLNTITVVNNNGCLAQGLPNLRLAQVGGTRMKDCYQFIQQDFAAIARAFGCVGITVTREQDIPEAFNAALSADAPVVIDLKSDPDALAPIPWMPN